MPPRSQDGAAQVGMMFEKEASSTSGSADASRRGANLESFLHFSQRPGMPGAEIGKEGGEDAERRKQRADAVHEANTGVISKLAEKCGADAA